MQSRLESLVEVLLNTVIGWLTAIITQIIVFPLFDIHVSFSEQIGISLIFTTIAIVRSYMIRRWFNKKLRLAAASIARKMS